MESEWVVGRVRKCKFACRCVRVEYRFRNSHAKCNLLEVLVAKKPQTVALQGKSPTEIFAIRAVQVVVVPALDLGTANQGPVASLATSSTNHRWIRPPVP